VVVSGLLKAAGVEALLVEAGCPWENGFVESLNSILRDEMLNTELFATVKVARDMATAWQRNERQGNGSLITTGSENRGKPAEWTLLVGHTARVPHNSGPGIASLWRRSS